MSKHKTLWIAATAALLLLLATLLVVRQLPRQQAPPLEVILVGVSNSSGGGAYTQVRVKNTAGRRLRLYGPLLRTKIGGQWHPEEGPQAHFGALRLNPDPRPTKREFFYTALDAQVSPRILERSQETRYSIPEPSLVEAWQLRWSLLVDPSPVLVKLQAVYVKLPFQPNRISRWLGVHSSPAWLEYDSGDLKKAALAQQSGAANAPLPNRRPHP